MKLARHYLESIAGIEIYPIISFIIFFVFFILVTWYVLTLDKKHIDDMASLAIDGEEDESGKTTVEKNNIV